MSFLWDAANIAHIARHDVTCEEAEQVIANSPIDLAQQRRNGEIRVLQIGETDAGRVLNVVVTTRNRDIRVVTAHPSNRRLREFYALQKAQRDE